MITTEKEKKEIIAVANFLSELSDYLDILEQRAKTKEELQIFNEICEMVNKWMPPE